MSTITRKNSAGGGKAPRSFVIHFIKEIACSGSVNRENILIEMFTQLSHLYSSSLSK